MRQGEKREEVTDISVTSAAKSLAFTRSYRQTQQSIFQTMGLGWIHNHATQLQLLPGAPNKALVRMTNGGELYLTQSPTDTTLYTADPGSSATLKMTGSQYILTPVDRSTFVFGNITNNVGQLLQRAWPTGETWTYTYNGAQLDHVDDGYGRQLRFGYLSHPGQYDDGQFWRVGDQTASGLSGNSPSGRYVEFGYAPEALNGTPISSAKALLIRIRDVRGDTWTYTYYGQAVGETDATQSDYLVGSLSPQVDLMGNGQSGSPLFLKNLNYGLVSGQVSSIVQQNGMLPAELAVDGDFEDGSGTTWPGISGAVPPTNVRSATQVHTGQYARSVVTSALGQGIQSNAWNMIAGRAYVLTAWVYPASGTTVTMQLSSNTAVSRSSRGANAWELLQVLYKPTSTVTNCTLQFIGATGTASFYVDSASIAEFDLTQVGITSQNGGLGVSTSWQFQPGGQNVTTETTAGKTTTHLFSGGVYVGDQDPAGNSATQVPNNVYRPVTQTDGNGHATQLAWNTDGGQLLSVKDAANNTTNFSYNQGKPFDGTLNFSLDALGHKTLYVYDSLNSTRQPSAALVTTGADLAINGDMENDDGTWLVVNSATTDRSTVQVNTGTYARHVVATSANAGLQQSTAVNLVPGRVYMLIAHVYAVSGTVQMSMTGVAPARYTYTNTSTTSLGQWQTVRGVFTVTAPTSGVLQFLAVTNPAEFYVDTVSVLDSTALLNWQEFSYDTRGRTLIEQALDPATGSVQHQTERVYYTSGNGIGLLQTLTQRDLINPANTTTTTYFYDSAARVVRTNQSATFGNCLSSYTVYDAAGNVIASLCNYDSNGQPDPTSAAAAITLYQTAYPGNPDKNRVTTYVYDALGRRVQTTTDAGAPYAQTSLTVYDGLNRGVRTIANYVPVTGISNPYVHSRADFTHGINNDQNLITETAYNERGFTRSQIDGLGNVVLYGYDDAGRLVTTVQNASQPAYDNTSLGSDPSLSRYVMLVTSSRPDQDIAMSHQYDAAGNLIRTTDVWGNVSLTGYDVLNRPVRTVQNASQPTYNLSVDPTLANYVPSTNVDQDLTTYTEYDALGRVRRTQDTLGSWTLYAYDALGRQTATVRNASAPQYDARRDATFSNYPVSAAPDQDVLALTTYDTFGRVLYTTDVLGRRTWSAYDGLGRVVQTITNAVGTATDNGTHDPRSPLYGASTDADKDLITTTTYDTNGYVVYTTDMLGRRTWTAYDSVGRQVKVIGNASGTATDNGPRDPRSPLYAPNSASDQDVISQTIYNAQGRVAATFDTLGRQTQYAYDTLGRQIRTITNFVTGVYKPQHPDQDLITTTTYDLAGRVVATVDPRGTQTTFIYDALGRRLMVTQAAGTALATTSYTCYDKGGRVLRVIRNWRPASTDPSPDARDSQGNWLFNPTSYGLANDCNLITSYTFDQLGRQLTSTGPYSLVRLGLQQLQTQMTYYKDGQIELLADTGDVVTKYRYDGLRRRILVVQGYQDDASSWGDPATWQWNASAGQWQTSGGVAIGHDGPYSNDPLFPDKLRHPNSCNLIAQVSYDRAGRVLSQRDPNGHLTRYTYDLLDRRTSLADPLNHTWQTAYTRLSNGQTRTLLTDANNTQTQQTFDRAGRLSAIQYLNESPKLTPDVAFTYDKLGNRLAMAETNGASPVRTTTYNFDQARRLLGAAFDLTGNGSNVQTVSYQYDPGGLRTQLTLPDGKTVGYTYDARGQLVTLTDWTAQTVRYDYDQTGRLGAIERANGLRSAYQYDASSRLTQLRHVAVGKTLAQFDYKPGTRGNRVQIQEAIRSASPGTTTLTSTSPAISFPLGTWSTVNSFAVSSNFSAALHVAFMGGPLTLKLGQGPDHGLCDIYIDDAFWQSFDGYVSTATDVPATLTIPLNNDGPHTLEIRNRPEKNKQSSGFKVRFYNLSVPILYDLHTLNFQRPLVVNSALTIQNGGYDSASRLWAVDYFAGDNLTAAPYLQYDYAYDLAGNRTGQTVTHNGTPTTTTYTYDAANRLGSDGTNTYQYDANGNLTNVNNASVYQWDRANRLLSEGGVANLYNGLGQRVQQTVGGQVTQYLLDVQPGLWKVLAATQGTNTTRYVHGLSGIQHQYAPGATTPQWTIQDGLGSVRGVADNTNALQESRFYSPYGELSQTSGSSQSVFGFTGEPTDANGLVHLRARYYNPALGQFVSLDPLETPNRFAYVQGNPVNWADPLGYGPEICLAALAGGPIAPELGLGCLLGVGAITLGGLALAYFGSQAARNTPRINIYSPGPSGSLTLDQAIQQYTQTFSSLERTKSQVCSGLPPGGERERCEQGYTLREQQELARVLGPVVQREIYDAAQEAEEYINELFQQDEGTQTLNDPFVPPLPTLCPTPTNSPSCKVEVRSLLAHLFIIFTDSSGVEYLYRGGPYRSFFRYPLNPGPITTRNSGTVYGTTPTDLKLDAPRVTVQTGQDACGKKSCLDAEAARIDSLGIPYRIFGPNSNTVVSTMLNKCGIQRRKPVLFTPGWNCPDLTKENYPG